MNRATGGDGPTPVGRYRHFKGDDYDVLGEATDSTNDAPEGRVFIIYRSVKFGWLHVRRSIEFHEFVSWPDGERRPRFVLVAP